MNWEPQDKQRTALEIEFDELLYGGGRGGGKTEGLLAWFSYDTEYPFYRALIIRKNADDLRDWLDRARSFYRPLGGEVVGHPPEVRFPKGGKIWTGHLKDENAYMKYQGQEIPKIGIEELSQIAREKYYLQLIGSCRSSHPEIKPQVFNTTNADEPGIEWIKERWHIPDMPDFSKIYTRKTPEGKILVFVPAKLEDNPILMRADPNYLRYLDSLKEKDHDLWEAWRLGNWKGFGTEGSYYRQQLERAYAERRVTDVPYEETLEVHTWCDLGIGDSFCIGYFQISGLQWRMIDYDEFEGESLVSAIERMKAKGYRYGNHYAPPDIQVRDLGSGKSRLEIAQQNGVNYIIVPKLSVDDGIQAVRARFSTIWFDQTKCDLFLKRIRRYHKEFDDKRGVWKNIPVHDINSHPADMLRYWGVTDFRPEGRRVSSYKPRWDVGRHR
jgi:hypothetical protein